MLNVLKHFDSHIRSGGITSSTTCTSKRSRRCAYLVVISPDNLLSMQSLTRMTHLPWIVWSPNTCFESFTERFHWHWAVRIQPLRGKGLYVDWHTCICNTSIRVICASCRVWCGSRTTKHCRFTRKTRNRSASVRCLRSMFLPMTRLLLFPCVCAIFETSYWW